jgi:Domain of unknown function (DU1801)
MAKAKAPAKAKPKAKTASKAKATGKPKAKAKATNKTQPTRVSAAAYIAAQADPARRADCEVVAAMMAKATGEPAVMWGTSIVGFGSYHYVYDSGREGDAPRVAFSSRKPELVLYLLDGYDGREALLAKLGPHRIGAACLYVKRLADLDLKVLQQLVVASVKAMKQRYP